MANPLVGSGRGCIGRGGGSAATGVLGSPAYRVLGPRARIRAYKLAQKNQEARAVLTGIGIGWRRTAAAPASGSGGSSTAELGPDSGEAGSQGRCRGLGKPPGCTAELLRRIVGDGTWWCGVTAAEQRLGVAEHNEILGAGLLSGAGGLRCVRRGCGVMFKGRAPKISACAQWETITEIAAASSVTAGAKKPDHATTLRDPVRGTQLLEGDGAGEAGQWACRG